MAMPVGAKRAASQAAAWIVAGGCAAFSVVYYAEIKEIARGLVGLPDPAGSQVVRRERAPDRTEVSSSTTSNGRTVELRVGAHGHFYANADINGRRINVMVDTGATMVALTDEDARRAGIYIRNSDYTQLVRTANGVARFAPVVLDRVSIGGITVRNVSAAVSEPGRLSTSLLGMSFLNRLNRVDMRSGVLVLQE